MPRREKESYSIQSVEYALAVLEALSEEGDEVRITDLSERLGMNKTSVFRLLATLESRGYVEREQGTGKYRLGLSAYEIGQKFLSRMGLLRHARPVVERLVRKCNEAIYIAIRRGDQILFLDLIDSGHQVRVASRLGNRYPLTANAAGKIILAHALAREPAPRQLKAQALCPEEALQIRQQGYCRGPEPQGEGVIELAVPLFDATGATTGVLCMVAPGFRMTEEKIESEHLPLLRETGEIISSKLGYLGHFRTNGWQTLHY